MNLYGLDGQDSLGCDHGFIPANQSTILALENPEFVIKSGQRHPTRHKSYKIQMSLNLNDYYLTQIHFSHRCKSIINFCVEARCKMHLGPKFGFLNVTAIILCC